MSLPDLRRRTHLFAPGLNQRFVEKALVSDADAVVIDLEDGIDQTRVHDARGMLEGIAEAAHARPTHVRVGMDSSGYREADLRLAVNLRAETVRLPKVEEPELVGAVASLLDREAVPTTIHLTIESARGLVSLADLIAASSRVSRIVFGERDFLADMGVNEPGPITDHARASIAVSSRAAGIGSPLDGAYVDLDDFEGLQSSCERARAFGFGGKSAIHPKQLAMIQKVFSLGDADLKRARTLVDAFDRAQSQGEASVVVDGRFIDEALAKRARSMIEEEEGL